MNGKIVIIDDSDLVLEMARDILEAEGYRVFTASNGIEANQHIFSPDKPVLIILDVMMPLLDGDKKLKVLKSNEHSKDIPIIYLSSKSDEELQNLVAATGADGYLCKPFSEEELLHAVRKYAIG